MDKMTKQELEKWERDWDFHKWKEDLFRREVIYVTAEKVKEFLNGYNPIQKLLAAPQP